MGSAILQAVQLLSENLEMDVGVRLVEDPDDPTPDFLFEVEALDQPGDLCDAPIDTDGDSQNLPDTHQNCGPGATPQFSVTFTNRPAPNNVPLNTGDPNGGYQMRLELIGDGQYVVDSIPVYIIPEDVVPDGGMEVFDAEGVYTQSFSATGCQGTELPDWDVLSWNATMPEGTSLRWEACLESTAELLAQCTDEDYVLIANVAGGGTCGASSDCTRGFCQAGKCQIVTGPACSDASECGNGGTCVEGACDWASLPVDTAPALANGLYSRIHMSLRVVMGASEGGTAAPTLHDWQIEYLCGSSI